MNDVKPYLVDVPVRVNVWIRPECQQKQFAVLKQARPSIMFLISDGGRNEVEWEAIRQNRALFDEQIDWDCTVYKLYEDHNNGLYTMARKGADLIWSKVDRCIFLEDDQLPSVCYFRFCAELLEKYKDDTRITAIAAMNHAGVWERASADYFFCERGAIWGLATWKRSFAYRENAFAYGDDPYVFNLLKQRTKHVPVFSKRMQMYAKQEVYGGHVAGGEFYQSFNVYAHNQLFIVPKYNMMCNIGCTADSAHASEFALLPKAIRRIFNMKTYEYEFPLKHPQYMVPDADYRELEDRTLATGRPLRTFKRRIEVFFLVIRHRGLDGIKKKISKQRERRGKIET